MELFFQKCPESYTPVDDPRVPTVIIPGLFGSSVNWRSFAKKLSDYCPVIVVDQRNHGRSQHADTHDYLDMTADLLEFLDGHGLEQVNLCGHSMGGKVAMVFSLLHSERVNELAVLDIAPVEYAHSYAPYLEKMISLDLDALLSRSDADKQLSEVIPDSATRLFLLQSLTGSQGNFVWRLNLPVLLKELPKILSFPWFNLDGLTHNGNTLFVSGEQSDYLLEAHHNQVLTYFPSAEFAAIPRAGHWLHAEQPQSLLEVLLNFLQFGKKND